LSWDTARLSEIATIERSSISPADIKSGSRYVGLDHIESGGGSIRFGSVENGELASNKFQFGPNHILFGKLRPYLAKVVCPDFSGICSTDIIPIAPSKRVDKRYLLHFLRRPETIAWAAGRTTGVNLPRLSPKELASLEIPIPPLDEQRRMAAILDKADELRRKRKSALELLNSLAQSIFVEMFGDPLKDHKDSGDWTTESLDASIRYIDYRGKTPPKAETGIRLITAKNVKMGYINPEPMEFIEADAYDDWMTRGFPEMGDVLFTTEAPLGNVAILDSSDKLAVGQRLLTMQPDKSKITSEYLAYFLRSPEFSKKMLENSTGSTVRGIKSRLLKRIDICYPPLGDQEHFSAALRTLTPMKEQANALHVGTNSLFSSLQHRAFSGQL
jgi:type I restriction enzyme S subunit